MSETTDRRGVIAGVLADPDFARLVLMDTIGTVADDVTRKQVEVILGIAAGRAAEQIDQALGQGEGEGEREGTTAAALRRVEFECVDRLGMTASAREVLRQIVAAALAEAAPDQASERSGE